MDIVDKLNIIDEAMGFVQKLPYQEKEAPKGSTPKQTDSGKKRLSAADIALLKSRGGTGKFTTTKSSGKNLSSTPPRQEVSNKEKMGKEDDKALVKVGDIFYNSWGYDQTNIDWYQVVEVSPTGKTCKVRRIAGDIKGGAGNSMAGYTTPVKNKFSGPPIQKKIRVSGKEVNLPFKHGWTPKWDGKPQYVSWYA